MKKRRLIPPALRRPRLTGGKCGPPIGSRNALKYGDFTRERLAFYAEIRAHIRRGRELVEAFERDRRPTTLLPS